MHTKSDSPLFFNPPAADAPAVKRSMMQGNHPKKDQDSIVNNLIKDLTQMLHLANDI